MTAEQYPPVGADHRDLAGVTGYGHPDYFAVVDYGTDLDTPRPLTQSAVYWKGTGGFPANAVSGDVTAREDLSPADLFLAKTVAASTYLPQVGGTLSGYAETLATLPTSGTVTLDFATSNAWVIAPTAAVTIDFANLPEAGKAAPGTLIVANSSFSITWPAGTKYPGAAAPVLDGETWLSLVARSTHVTVGAAWSAVA